MPYPLSPSPIILRHGLSNLSLPYCHSSSSQPMSRFPEDERSGCTSRPCQGSPDERGGKCPPRGFSVGAHGSDHPRQRPPARCKLLQSKFDLVTADQAKQKTTEEGCRTPAEKEGGVSLRRVWVPQSKACASPRLREK